jgi:hypothetical protein
MDALDRAEPEQEQEMQCRVDSLSNRLDRLEAKTKKLERDVSILKVAICILKEDASGLIKYNNS